jgi:hypothetical protein
MNTSVGQRVVYRISWDKPFDGIGVLESFASESDGRGEELTVNPVAIIRNRDGTFTSAYIWNIQLAGEAEAEGKV